MAWNLGGGSQKSSNSSSFNQNVMPQQIPALTGLWGSAADLYGHQAGNFGNYQQMSSYLTPWMFQQAQAAQPAYGQQLGGGIQDPNLTRQFNQFMDNPSATQSIYADVLGGASQSYADPLVNQLRQDMQINMNRGPMRDMNTGFNKLGRAGSDRNVLQRALTDAENNRNFGVLSAGIRNDSQAKDMAMRMKIAEQADANKLGGLQLGFDSLNQRNANQQGAFGLGSAVQNMGMGMFAPMMQGQGAMWNPMMNYGNIIGGPQVLSSGTSSGKSSGWNFGAGAGGV